MQLQTITVYIHNFEKPLIFLIFSLVSFQSRLLLCSTGDIIVLVVHLKSQQLSVIVSFYAFPMPSNSWICQSIKINCKYRHCLKRISTLWGYIQNITLPFISCSSSNSSYSSSTSISFNGKFSGPWSWSEKLYLKY
jgi:hypothetical protein